MKLIAFREKKVELSSHQWYSMGDREGLSRFEEVITDVLTRSLHICEHGTSTCALPRREHCEHGPNPVTSLSDVCARTTYVAVKMKKIKISYVRLMMIIVVMKLLGGRDSTVAR